MPYVVLVSKIDNTVLKSTTSNLSNNQHQHVNPKVTFIKVEKTAKNQLMKDDSTSQKQLRENQEPEKKSSETAPPKIPRLVTSDGIDQFMSGIGHQIRRLPENVHTEVIIDILTLIQKKERQYLK